jgi:outer membrane protein OmpA-like peptidoglycan-associated protein
MKLTLLALAGLLCLTASAQDFVGYGNDNYSGVNSLLSNPAMLAGSKYKVNVNLFSVSAAAGNNAFELDQKKLFGLHLSNLQEGSGYYKAPNHDYKYLYFNTDILGPSAMININHKNAVALITRMRVMGNESNLSDGIFRLFGNGDPLYNNIDIIDRSLQNKMHAFADAGVSFGRILVEKPTTLFKVGITAKYIAGLAAASLSTGQMTANIDPANNITKLDADMTAQYSSNLDNLGSGSFSDLWHKQAGHGLGFDLGMVYEWRPANLANDPTPYRLRLGLAVTDIGSVKYTNSTFGNTYSMNADGSNATQLEVQKGETYSQYFNRLQTNNLIVAKGTAPPTMKVSLPTAIHIDADYHVYKRIFINGEALINMVSTTSPVSPNYVTAFTVTPRMEKKWISIYSPISYSAQGLINWGAGIRLGPLFVGSGSVLSNLLQKKIPAADVHIGLTVPIFKTNEAKKAKKEAKNKNAADTVYKVVSMTSDRDGDGVVDGRDACPDSAGPIALIGCPDRDGDGVPNYLDKCPDVPGSPKNNGCPIPDTDGDGINDDEDACPLVKGLASNHGCPPIKKEIVSRINHAAERIFFIRAKDIIEKNSYEELDRVVEILKSDPTLHLHIEGHTDNEGTDQRNQNLSDRRAKAVKHYLEKKGIADKRMDYKGYGSTRPIASNATPEGMAQNRRVEMKLTNWENKEKKADGKTDNKTDNKAGK